MGKAVGRGLALALAAAVVAGLVAGAGPRPAGAAAAGQPAAVVEVVGAGWGGRVVPGTWTPVRVRVTAGGGAPSGGQAAAPPAGGQGGASAGASVAGAAAGAGAAGAAAGGLARVELVVKNREERPQPPGQGGPPETVETPVVRYVQEVTLAPGTAKELTFWFQALPRTVAEVGAAGQPSRRVEFLEPAHPAMPLVGVLGSPDLAAQVQGLDLPVQGLPGSVPVAALQPADIPDGDERLGALTALVVQGSAAAALTDAQRQAIFHWVKGGGHLLLVGGAEGLPAAAALPPGTLPVQVAGAMDGAVAAQALSRWLGAPAPGPLAARPVRVPGGQVLAPVPGPAAPDWALAARAPLGQGTVTVLAVDPAQPPLARWEGLAALWRQALAPALPSRPDEVKMSYAMREQGDVLGRLAGAAEWLPPEAFPGWRHVALVLGGYALLAGPVLYFILGRLGRREWAWALVPLAALGFAAALYVGGVRVGGRDVLANAVAHVRLYGDGTGREALLVSFYAPTRERLAVAAPAGPALRVMAGAPPAALIKVPPGAPVPAGTEPPVTVTLRGPEAQVTFDAPAFNTQRVAFQRPVSGAGRVTAQIRIEGETLVGRVKNGTPYRLEDAALLVGASGRHIGHLAPGEEREVQVELVSWRREERYSVGLRVFGQPVATPAGYPPGEPRPLRMPDDPELRRRAQILDAVAPQFAHGPYGASPADGAAPVPQIVGFVRQPIGGPVPSAGRQRAFYTAVVQQDLGFALPPGPVTLSEALLPPRMLESKGQLLGGGSFGGPQGWVRWVDVAAGSLVYEYQLPPIPGLEVASLTVTTQQVGPSVPWNPGQGGAPMQGPPSTAGPEAGVFAIYHWGEGRWLPLEGRETHRLSATGLVGPEGRIRVRIEAPPGRLVHAVIPGVAAEGRVAP